MIFYRLKLVETSKEKDPSIQKFRDGYDVYSPNSATNIQSFRAIDFTPDLDFKLHHKGNASDFIEVSSGPSVNFCVTTEVFTFLNEFSIWPFQSFDTTIRKRNEKLAYHYLHFIERFDSDENEIVDFSKTVFISEKTTEPVSCIAIPTDEEGILGEFQVSSWGEFLELRDKIENDDSHKVILPKRTLYVQKKEVLNFDLLLADFGNWLSPIYLVSERVAEAIKKNNFTGVEIKPITYEIELS